MVDVRRGMSDKPLDLSTASSIDIRLRAEHSIGATVEVKSGSAILARTQRELRSSGTRPSRSARVAGQAAANADSQAVRDLPLPGPIDELAVGADRYLVLACRNPSMLVIFDAATAEIVKSIPLTGKAFVAAGSKSFVVGYPAKGVLPNLGLRRHDETKKVEIIVLRDSARLQGIAMGSQTEGPLLVIWDVDPPAGRTLAQRAFSEFDPRLRAVLFDPDTLTVIKLGKYDAPGSARYKGPEVFSKDNKCWFVPNPNLVRYAGNKTKFFPGPCFARGDLFAISSRERLSGHLPVGFQDGPRSLLLRPSSHIRGTCPALRWPDRLHWR